MADKSIMIPVKSYNVENELESILRHIDEPIPLIENGVVDTREIELKRVVPLVDFCRGLLCGIKVGKNG